MGTADLKPIDLDQTTPTLLPDKLREASQIAYEKAADPLNVLDNNPFIAREWVIVGVELYAMARAIEIRLLALFAGDPPP